MTQNLHKNFDKIISSKLENQSVDVNNGLWENINSRLLEKQILKSKRLIRFQRIAIIFITALFITSLIIFINTKNESKQSIAFLKKENTRILQDKTRKLNKQENTSLVKKKKKKNMSQSTAEDQFTKSVASTTKKDEQNHKASNRQKKQLNVHKQTQLSTNNGETTTQQLTATQKTPVEEEEISTEILSDNEISENANIHLTEDTNAHIVKNFTSDLTENSNPLLTENKDDSLSEQATTNQELSLQTIPVPENGSNLKEQKKFAVQIFVSPEYSYRSLRNNNAYFNPKYDKAYFNSRDKGQFTFSAGLLFSARIKHKLTIATGVSYSKFSQKFTTKGVNIETSDIGNGYLYTSTGITNISTNNSDTALQQALLRSSLQLSYINLPIVAEYYYLPNLFIQGGINFNILAKEDMNWQAENNSDDNNNNENIEVSTNNNIEGLKTTNVSFIIGAGKEFPFLKTYKFVFQPSFRIFVTSINNKNTVKTYPYSYFLHFGIKKTF